MIRKIIQITGLVVIVVLIGCRRLNSDKLTSAESSIEKKDDTLAIKIESKQLIFQEKEEIFSDKVQTMIDTTPIRLLPHDIRAKITPTEHYFGNLILSRRITGTYSFQNDSILIKEVFPNVLEYTAKDYGRLDSKVEYYDSNKILLATADLRNIPLDKEYLNKITFRYHNEFITTVIPYNIAADFKEKADSLYVNIEVFSSRNTAFRTVGYYIWGVDENDLVIGYECIVLVLNNIGKPVFQQTFGKPVSGSFISEKENILCLNFTAPRYSDINSPDGVLIIKDLRTGENLVNYQASPNEIKNGGLGFQEIKENYVFFLFGPATGKKTNEVYSVEGLIDFRSRRLYKRTLSKQELKQKQEKNLYYFKIFNIPDWTLFLEF